VVPGREGWQDRLQGLGFPCGGGDGTDSKSAHDQHDVAQQSGVVADLGVVEPEMVLLKSSSTGLRKHATRTRVRPAGCAP
jgi:hypothetical protein